MRPGQQNNKRMRGRNRKGQNALTRSYESNGGDVKIRGTALHIAEKYVQLSRDAASSGDRVAAEHYLQHAEHYYRILAAAQAQMPQPQPIVRSDDDSDVDDDDDSYEAGPNGQGGQYPAGSGEQPSVGPNDPQPYVNGNGHGGANGQEQSFDGGQPAENREGRSHRGRRRRPFRDRQGGERAPGDEGGGAEAGNGGMETAQPMAAEPAASAGQPAED